VSVSVGISYRSQNSTGVSLPWTPILSAHKLWSLSSTSWRCTRFHPLISRTVWRFSFWLWFLCIRPLAVLASSTFGSISQEVSNMAERSIGAGNFGPGRTGHSRRVWLSPDQDTCILGEVDSRVSGATGVRSITTLWTLVHRYFLNLQNRRPYSEPLDWF
jgi:hypothetical protein